MHKHPVPALNAGNNILRRDRPPRPITCTLHGRTASPPHHRCKLSPTVDPSRPLISSGRRKGSCYPSPRETHPSPPRNAHRHRRLCR
jgi:hypothetical protein